MVGIFAELLGLNTMKAATVKASTERKPSMVSSGVVFDESQSLVVIHRGHGKDAQAEAIDGAIARMRKDKRKGDVMEFLGRARRTASNP